jgi:hypothetical protein
LDVIRRPSNKQPPASIELHIEDVVLHGFAASDRYRIGEALQSELTRLLTEHGLPSALSLNQQFERLDVGAIQLVADSKPETTGIQIARTVWGEF